MSVVWDWQARTTQHAYVVGRRWLRTLDCTCHDVFNIQHSSGFHLRLDLLSTIPQACWNNVILPPHRDLDDEEPHILGSLGLAHLVLVSMIPAEK